MNNENRRTLNSICKLAGFTKIGSTFYRVHGDGVIQVLKYSKRTRPFYEEKVDIGLFSMYGELYPHVLNPKECCPTYNSLYLVTPKWQFMKPFFITGSINSASAEGIVEFHFNPMVFQSTAIPFLEKVNDQKKLLDALFHLDYVCSHIKPDTVEAAINWVDMNEYAPFLHERDCLSAETVVMSYLKLYLDDQKETDFSKSFEHIDQRAENLRQKLVLAKSKNEKQIGDYLERCYKNNSELLTLLLRTASSG